MPQEPRGGDMDPERTQKGLQVCSKMRNGGPSKPLKNMGNITFWHLEERLESSLGGPEGIRGFFMTPSKVMLVTLRDPNEDSM